MKKINFSSAVIFSLALSTSVFAQTGKKQTIQAEKAPVPKPVLEAPVKADPVLMTISGENVTLSEFDRVFRKNNRDSVFTEKSVRDYLELYVNYKLKVREAESLKMDTSEAFISELAGYRKQLAQPYLTDKEVSEQLIREAYDRLNKDVRASHILLKLPQDALPKDTLAVYNRIMKIRDMIAKGADFSKMARDSSEDPSAKDNSGDLGYFTGMQMVYPFETVAFNTKPGTVSMPVRTRFGFHIIKVIDVRPAQGELHVAHIMVRTPKEESDSARTAAEAKIREALSALKSGMPWDTAVIKYSEDKGSARKGGELPWFGTGRMVPEFEKAAFSLSKQGDISEIVKSSYGYHIIRLLDKRGIPPFDEKKAELKQMISRDSRNEASRLSMIAKIKTQYGFKEIAASRDELINSLDSTILEGEWDLTKAEKFGKNLISLTEAGTPVTQYTQQDFAKYITTHQTKRSGATAQAIGQAMYEQWVGETCLSFYEARLDKNFVDFRNLMKEYRDGILLFDLTDKMVWSKAVKDTSGLEDFYKRFKNNYLWGERCDAVVYSGKNEKAMIDFRKQLAKGKKSASDIINEIGKNPENAITQREGRFTHGENEIIELSNWKPGMSEVMSRNNIFYVVDLKQIIPVMPKTLDEARGVITADYQTYLENQWLSSLHSKYKIEINDAVLQKMWK